MLPAFPREDSAMPRRRAISVPGFRDRIPAIGRAETGRLVAGLLVAVVVLAVLTVAAAARAETLFVAEPFTPAGSFTPGIEGPACDREGAVYAVNLARQGTIGRVAPDGSAEVFLALPGTSVGNGIRFAADGTMFVADYVNHNVFRVPPGGREPRVFAHDPRMNQPNDLAIAADGTLYASDPDWKAGTGQLWRIDVDGTTTRLATGLGTTNGIDLSPDGRTLYVNQSVQRDVFAFEIRPDRSLGEQRLLRRFPDHGFDGMRCDAAGNLHITRYGKGTVVVMEPDGDIVREVDVLGARPSNICFGGPDGRTVYVTEVEHARLVRYRTDVPGLSFTRWAGSSPRP
jgi:gluconolactonase